jgi:plastocyanin
VSNQTTRQGVRLRMPLHLAIPLGIVVVIGLSILVLAKILLDVPEGVAAAIAAVTALNIVGAFAFVATRQSIDRKRIIEVFGISLYPIVIGAVIAYVGFGSTTEAKGGGASGPTNTLTDITISAANVAFNTDTITAAAGKQITVHFDNKDSVAHNIAFFDDKSAKKKIYVGSDVQGGATADYSFKTPTKPGSYFFRCDIHPTSMTGTFVVKKG